METSALAASAGLLRYAVLTSCGTRASTMAVWTSESSTASMKTAVSV